MTVKLGRRGDTDSVFVFSLNTGVRECSGELNRPFLTGSKIEKNNYIIRLKQKTPKIKLAEE